MDINTIINRDMGGMSESFLHQQVNYYRKRRVTAPNDHERDILTQLIEKYNIELNRRADER